MENPVHGSVLAPGGRCDPGRHSRSLSGRQIAMAIAGVAVLVAGVAIDPESIPTGPVLITAGGLLLLFGVALPLVTQAELGAPLLFKVTLAVGERRARLREAVEDCRGLLAASAASLCPDDESATRAVEAVLSTGLGDWRGTDNVALRRYLLCLLVQAALFDTMTKPPRSDTEPFLRLPFDERAVVVLADRAGLDLASVAKMLGLAESEVASIRARALSKLAAPGATS